MQRGGGEEGRRGRSERRGEEVGGEGGVRGEKRRGSGRRGKRGWSVVEGEVRVGEGR